MRFIVRAGSDPVAAADAVLLRTLGLPYGGIVSVGTSHCLVAPADVAEPTALLMGPRAMANAGVSEGQAVDVDRAVLSHASLVVLDEDEEGDPAGLVAAWQGRPMTAGDLIDRPDGTDVRLLEVQPTGAGTMGPATRVVGRSRRPEPDASATVPAPPGPDESAGRRRPGPVVTGSLTESDALLAGLDSQRDLLAGWLTLLTSPDDLPATWGLPEVAGVWVEGPPGCGRPELVRAAAADIGVPLVEVSIERVFKPERLLDVLRGSLAQAGDRAVLFVDRVELLTGDDALSNYRTQFAAVSRWFIDTVAERPRVAVVLGTASIGTLDPALTANPLLPRSLSIPPPDLERRRLLFQAALADVPSGAIDHRTLATRTAGFSGADVVGAVLHASAGLAHRGGALTTEDLLAAVRDTTPSLGSTSIGDIPSHGFAAVANMTDVKQRLTEAVIWPITDPERFHGLGIDPPRGILLHGPPGTGKTFVVKAVAHEAGAAFFSVKGAELLDKYVGESERGVRELFARARTTAPAIIFFDELDALAPVRGTSTTSVTDTVVAALLTELDGVSERGRVAVIGATNRSDLIDPALLRSGRFETHIELGLPEVEARRALLELTDVPFDESVDLDRLADLTGGLSFADIEGMLREAALTALRRDHSARRVTWSDLESARGRFVTRAPDGGDSG